MAGIFPVLQQPGHLAEAEEKPQKAPVQGDFVAGGPLEGAGYFRGKSHGESYDRFCLWIRYDP